MSVTIAMACPNPQPPPAGPDPEVATICEASPTETVTWTMPRATFELVVRTMETWPVIWGRRPRATVERALDLLEQTGCPDIRTGVTRTAKPAEKPTTRGHQGFIIYDELLTAEQIAALDPGRMTKKPS